MNRREFSQLLLLSGAATWIPRSLWAQNPATQKTEKTAPAQTVHGTVKNAKTGEGLRGVRVSNGRDVVATDRLGRYELPFSESGFVFVCKPRGFAFSLNELQMPQFYRAASAEKSVDFALQPQIESEEFRVLLFGDPQSRNQTEVDYLTRDIIEGLIGVRAAFGVSLGDITFDEPGIYANQNRAIAQIGVPWHNVIGNHDLDFEASGREGSTRTFEATFGPTYYSFDYAGAHFVVLDDVAYDGVGSAPAGKNKGTYHTELGARQLEWLRNDLQFVDKNALVVLLCHIPIVALEGDENATLRDGAEFYRAIAPFTNTLSISAHTHFQTHRFIGRESGFEGAKPHHHFNCATTCGSWWRGALDERGIPHTTMRDGTPNGFVFLNVKGQNYTLDFQAAGAAPSHQINIYTPDSLKSGEKGELLVNVFNGNEKSRVEFQIAAGPWQTMEKVARPDPAYAARIKFEETLPKSAGRKLPAVVDCPHLWAAPLEGLSAGTHLVNVRETDLWGRVSGAKRILHVV